MIGTVGRRLAGIFCVYSVVCSGAITAPAGDLTPEQVAAIDRYMAAEMRREDVPGIAVGIYSRGQILLTKGYGLANIELSVPVKAETIFQSGSVGKQFTSAAIMMLVEEGKIGLDDSIVKYFPNAPQSWQAIRVKNLLSHTSGLSEYETDERAGPGGPFYIRLDFTEDELVNKIEALPIEFKPGEKWDYRNTNYVLLGAIIHKVTGAFYADYLRERIFKPLGMNSTRLITEADIIPNRSSGYEHKGEIIQNQSWVAPTFNSTADGALYFNVLDLAKWDAALYGTKLLKQSSLDQTWTVFLLNDGSANSANYGFGWEINSVNGHKQIDHGGAWQGFRCHVLRYPDDGVSVVVLANADSARPEQFAHVIAGIVNPALELPKLVAIEDKQPELARRLTAFFDQIVAGKDVKEKLSPRLAGLLTPDMRENVVAELKPIWPSDKITLVSRTDKDGITVSRYRIEKGHESRIVRFGLGADGKVATIGILPDPDVRRGMNPGLATTELSSFAPTKRYTMPLNSSKEVVVAAEKMFSPREASKVLGISYATVKLWIYKGKVRTIKTAGGHHRIPESQLDKFLHHASDKGEVATKRTGFRNISGRNQLIGRVTDIKISGLIAQVSLSIGGQHITSIVTADAVREMRLEVGDKAAALIKSTEVMILRA